MRKKLAIFGVAALIALGFGLVTASRAYADDILKDACTGAAANSDTCKSRRTSSNPLTGPDGTLSKVANILAVIAGVAAVIILLYSGIQYITAGGDAQKVGNAKNTIIGAVIGLVVIVLARSIIAFVINRL